ncbi:MAG: alcohol dehydrogenase catalytic domain-containing protein [Pseudomonadota bacterium]
MRALVYTAPEHLEVRDMPDPQPGQGNVLVEVESVGICGSDMHAYLGHDERRPAPLILGHEVAGRAISGDGTARRVTVNPLVHCGACPACRSKRENLCPKRQIISMPPREGGFAERIVIPGNNLVPVPDHISSDQAGLTEPIACGWHAARLAIAAQGQGAKALVIGGGAIGLGAALSLRAQGVSDILMSEPNETRRRYLSERTSETVRAPDAMPAEPVFDIVVDGVGYAPTRAQASALVKPGGIIVHIGLGNAEGGLDIRRMTLQEITFVGTYTYTAQDFRDTAAAMFDGRLGPLDWVDPRALAQGAQAFEDIRSGTVPAPKIILKPGL